MGTGRFMAIVGGATLMVIAAMLMTYHLVTRPTVMVPTPNVTTEPWSEERKTRIRTECMRQWGGRHEVGMLNQCLNQIPRDFDW